MMMNYLLGIFCGVGLSAACGFRIFVPPVILSTAAIYGDFDLPPDLEILGTETGLIAVATLLAVEAIVYFIPGVDHALDILEAPIAMVVATLIVAAFLPDMEPRWMWTVSIILGAGSAGVIEMLMGITRVASTMATGGLANPLVSTMELLCAMILSVLAISLPILGAITVAIVLVLAVPKILRRNWQRS